MYPGIGFLFGTSHPIVAVVSGSMEHQGLSFENWWDHGTCIGGRDVSTSLLYSKYNISKEQFESFWFKNGFNTGDLMILVGDHEPDVGDVVVFFNPSGEPIIHRAVQVKNDPLIKFKTKGDNNCGSLGFEESIPSQAIIGKAVVRIPLLGWVKIVFLKLLDFIGLLEYMPWFR